MKALMVIDMLEDFFYEGVLAEQRSQLVQSINRLIYNAQSKSVAIIFVRQEFKEDLSDAFLDQKKRKIQSTIMGTTGSQILSELHRLDSDIEIIKKRYSAFFQTPLDQVLAQQGIHTLIMCGVNTHACIRMAAIDAYQRDMKVIIPEPSVASHDVEHHDLTLRYFLKSGIAEVVDHLDVF